MKKTLSIILVLLLALSCLTACGGGGETETPDTDANTPETAGPTSGEDDPSPEAVGGKILFMSNMNAGAQYEAYVAYLEMACSELGYTFEVIFGDEANDPAGNLTAVQNSMTNDVVGLIACQDGGIAEILAEFPDLYVVGFMSDMAGVYDEGGASTAAKDSDHFLGTIADQYINGADTGKMYFDIVVEKGYKKVATICFPPFAYPQLMVADGVFRGLVEEYNATAADKDKIEVVGEVEVLMFEPLSDSFFMEAERQDLDAIIAPLAGCTFVYPALKNAITSGTISPDTKLVTSGFESDSELLADFGDEGVISAICIGTVDSIFWPIAMLDCAIQGNMYADYSGSEQLDSGVYVIDSREDMDNVISKSLLNTGDIVNTTVPWELLKENLTRFSENATYEGLKTLLHSETLTVDALK